MEFAGNITAKRHLPGSLAARNPRVDLMTSMLVESLRVLPRWPGNVAEMEKVQRRHRHDVRMVPWSLHRTSCPLAMEKKASSPA